MANDWIQTASGKKFFPLSPREEDLDINDIAHALSNICRFTGHCKEFYSVAQHSVLVSLVCEPKDALWGLLHDASEAYLMDIATPVKRSAQMEQYRIAEYRLMQLVCKKFGLSADMPESVEKADTILLSTEVRDLLANPHPDWKPKAEPWSQKIEPVLPSIAKQMFLDRFRVLTG